MVNWIVCEKQEPDYYERLCHLIENDLDGRFKVSDPIWRDHIKVYTVEDTKLSIDLEVGMLFSRHKNRYTAEGERVRGAINLFNTLERMAETSKSKRILHKLERMNANNHT